MTRNALTTRLPWQDRWSQPSLEQLLHPLKTQQRRLMEELLDKLATFDGAGQSIIWYGPSWKWTIYYSYRDSKGRELEPLCYLVPNLANPVVCIPLSDALIESLPTRRLSKFVRDGISGAKCAVSIHWAVWTPATLGEVAQLVDLLQRKHQMSRPQQGSVAKSA